MRKFQSLACGAGLVLATAWVTPALANQAAEKKAEPPAAHQHDMSAEEKAMMEAYMKAGTPGKQHESLAKTAGKWDLSMKSWMAPGAPPTESKATAERAMVLGGRVLTEKVHGEAMGQPFEGHGMTGYDNVTGKYWSTWNDSMSTGIMTSTGTCDEAARSCSFMGTMVDAISGQSKNLRMVSKWTNDDHEVFEMWEPTPDGKEFKAMEIVYTRKK